MESKCYIQFQENISAAGNLEPLYTCLKKNAENVDASYLLRSEYVLIVSALDTYVHMVLEDKIVCSFFDVNQIASSLELPISEMKKLWVDDKIKKYDILRYCVKARLIQNSFQSPKSLEYAYSLINISKIWTKIKDGMNMGSEEIKKTLGLIVNRRNMIAHESDRNRVTGELQEINLQTIKECKEFIVNLVRQLETLNV